MRKEGSVPLPAELRCRRLGTSSGDAPAPHWIPACSEGTQPDSKTSPESKITRRRSMVLTSPLGDVGRRRLLSMTRSASGCQWRASDARGPGRGTRRALPGACTAAGVAPRWPGAYALQVAPAPPDPLRQCRCERREHRCMKAHAGAIDTVDQCVLR